MAVVPTVSAITVSAIAVGSISIDLIASPMSIGTTASISRG